MEICIEIDRWKLNDIVKGVSKVDKVLENKLNPFCLVYVASNKFLIINWLICKEVYTHNLILSSIIERFVQNISNSLPCLTNFVSSLLSNHYNRGIYVSIRDSRHYGTVYDP